MNPKLAIVRDWLAWYLSRVGMPGWLGLALLVCAALFDVGQNGSMASQLAELEHQADRLASQPASARALSSRSDWSVTLPAAQDAYVHLAMLFGAAQQAGLSLPKGNYREIRDGGSGPAQLAITLPISGSYGAIRAFAATALNQDPALALTSLSLERDGIGQARLAADMHFSLYMEPK